MRVSLASFLVVSLGTVFGPGVASAAGKVYVVPYAPIYQEAPVELGVRTASLVAEEIKAQGKLEPVAGPTLVAGDKDVASDPAARAKAVERAERFSKVGDERFQGLKLKEAEKQYRAALQALAGHEPFLEDLRTVADLQLKLAVVLFRTGQEEEGERLLADVLRLDPERKLDPSSYPPLFLRTYDAIRTKLMRLTRGGVSVVSTPPGADVYVDGRRMGKTPMLVRELIRGEHYVRLAAAGVDPWACKIDVVPTQVERLDVDLGGKLEGPLGELVGGISRNRIDAGSVERLHGIAKQIGADYVVLGAIHKAPDAFEVRSWLFETATRKLASLSTVSFDFEMLGASIEVYKLAAEVGDAVEQFPPTAGLPVTPFDGASQTAIKVSEVAAAAPVAPVQPQPQPEPEPEVDLLAGAPATAPEVRPEPTRGSGRQGPVRPAGPVGPVQPAGPVGPVQPAEPVQPQEDGPPVVMGGQGVIGPVGPMQPSEPAPRQERQGPIAAATIDADDADAQVGPASPVLAPVETQTEKETEPVRERQVIQVGGARGRLLDPNAAATAGDGPRYAALDPDEIVIPKDEIEEKKGWPWWAWGLVVVGAAGLGAGGYYASTQLGGGAEDATVTFKW